jgi:hypothetical protein
MAEPKKIVILALADGGMEHHRDCETGKLTWATEAHPNIRVVFIRTSEVDEIEYRNKMLYLPNSAEDLNILDKSILSMKWLLDNWEFDLLIRTNVSTYFELDKLYKLLSNYWEEENFFGGYVLFSDKYTEEVKNLGFVSGAGLVISINLVNLLAQGNLRKYSSFPDDVAISSFFYSLGFTAKNIKRNNLSVTHIFLPSAITRVKSTHSSELASVRMFLIHKYFVAQNSYELIKSYFEVTKFEIRNIRIGTKSFIEYLRNISVLTRTYFRK